MIRALGYGLLFSVPLWAVIVGLAYVAREMTS